MYTFNSIGQRFTDGRGVARPRRTRVADAIVADDARITRRRDRCHRRELQPPELIRISARRRARAGRSTTATGTRLPFPAGIYALAVIAKFHYTDTDTGPTRTWTQTFLRRNSVGSVWVRFAAKKVRVRVRVVEFSFNPATSPPEPSPSPAPPKVFVSESFTTTLQRLTPHCLPQPLTVAILTV